MSEDPETNEIASSGENEEDEIGSISSGSLEPPPEAETEPEADGEPEANQIRDRTDEAEQQIASTNVDSRLLQAQQSYKQDGRLRSEDLIPLTAKFDAFRGHLKNLMPLIKTYQVANRAMQGTRTTMYKDIGSLSVESPFYENVGKTLDSEKLSSTTSDEAMEYAESSGIKSLISVDQLALIHVNSMESEYHATLVDYVYEWEHVVANKVDNVKESTAKLGLDRQHYETKIKKLREEKTQVESRGKDLPPKKKERFERNERKLKDATQIHEDKASELCHLLEQIVDQGWQDLMPLVENTMKWEKRRYENEDAMYGTRLLPVLESLDQEISRLEAEETVEDLEAALSVQKEKNEALKHKLDKIKLALTGEWDTKNELFRTLNLA